MVRFYLASLFPKAPRLLYLDNDIIVACCLEEIWGTELDDDKRIVGLALDDLKWAAATQFKYHYNATHPLVIKNIRNHTTEAMLANPALAKEYVTEREFVSLLPRYPNDGVMLINVPAYSKHRILGRLNEIAMANSNGEWVVNLGELSRSGRCRRIDDLDAE